MSHKHKVKIEKLFEHPISGNIDARRMLTALEHYGAKIEITKHNKARIEINEEEFTLAISHNNNLSKDSVTSLRHFLEKVELTPDKIS